MTLRVRIPSRGNQNKTKNPIARNLKNHKVIQQILFLIVVLIGAYYARKYGNKAKRDIEKYNQNKEQDKIKNKLD